MKQLKKEHGRERFPLSTTMIAAAAASEKRAVEEVTAVHTVIGRIIRILGQDSMDCIDGLPHNSIVVN